MYETSHTGRVISVRKLSDTLDSEAADDGDTMNRISCLPIVMIYCRSNLQ